MRVSTTKQDVGRQTGALESWQKEKGIEIPSENIFIDYYTGKTFDRENYQKMKSKLQENDYLIIKEVDRLGRDWDGIKKEWQELKSKNVNIIILDLPILSDALPNEPEPIRGLESKLIRNQIFELMCYVAQKEREKISQRTKEALAEKKKNGTKSGKPIGRPISPVNSEERFIKTLELMALEGYGQRTACLKSWFTLSTFQYKLRICYNKYNTTDYREILERVRKDGMPK